MHFITFVTSSKSAQNYKVLKTSINFLNQFCALLTGHFAFVGSNKFFKLKTPFIPVFKLTLSKFTNCHWADQFCNKLFRYTVCTKWTMKEVRKIGQSAWHFCRKEASPWHFFKTAMDCVQNVPNPALSIPDSLFMTMSIFCRPVSPWLNNDQLYK